MKNLVILIGHLGQTPELKETTSTSVCNLSVATSERQKKGDQWESVTEWHRVVLFGKQAEFTAKYLKKGSLVYVEGKLRTSKWEKDGQKREKVEIVAHTIQSLSKKDDAPADYSKYDGKEDVPF
jgi:single-strand DNA-binding protein